MYRLAISTLRKEVDNCKLLITKYTLNIKNFKMGNLIDDLYDNPDDLNKAIILCKRQIHENLQAITILRKHHDRVNQPRKPNGFKTA